MKLNDAVDLKRIRLCHAICGITSNVTLNVNSIVDLFIFIYVTLSVIPEEICGRANRPELMNYNALHGACITNWIQLGPTD